MYFGDTMIYLFFNILMYFIINMMMVFIMKNKINIYNFIIFLFHLNLSFFFIYHDVNFIYFLLFSISTILIYKIIFYYKEQGEEIILIKDGNINFHNLLQYYSYQKLVNYLKIRNIKLDEISYFILRNNHLIIIKDKLIKNYPVSIIIDRIVKEENLKLIKKNNKWLDSELLKEKMNLENISYAYYLKDKLFFIKKNYYND